MDFDTYQVLTPTVSPGDGSASPAVSNPSPGDDRGDGIRLLETPIWR